MLKKILFGLTLAATMTACTDDYNDWEAPQANGPEESKNIEVSVADVAPIDLAQVEGDSIVVFTPSLVADETASVKYELKITDEATQKEAVLEADTLGRVAVADIEKVIFDFYGKRPTERTLAALVTVYVNVSGQVVKRTAETTLNIKVTPEAPLIEDAYYLVGDGLGWSAEGALAHPFAHSGKDVYDDPVFTITVPAPCGEGGVRTDFCFKVVPASALEGGDLNWDKVIGSDTADGDDRPEAGIKVAGGAFKRYAADEAKFYQITLNMLDGKIKAEGLNFNEFIYMPGNPQQWNPGNAPALRSPNFDGKYIGYAVLDGEFKFTKARSWDGGEYNFNDFNQYGEGFTNGGGSNINWTGGKGFYQISVDLSQKSLSAVKTAWGIIGPAQTGGWDNDTDMTYNEAESCWEVTVDLKADEFKFRANDGWDINFGGATDDLVPGGNNIRLAEAGNYTVKLYLSLVNGQTKRYCTLTKN